MAEVINEQDYIGAPGKNRTMDIKYDKDGNIIGGGKMKNPMGKDKKGKDKDYSIKDRKHQIKKRKQNMRDIMRDLDNS